MVLPDSYGIPLAPHYLGIKSKEPNYFRLQDYHPLWSNFPESSANNLVSYSSSLQQSTPKKSLDTFNTTVAAFNMLIGLGYFPFARHYLGNHYCFLFLRVLRCFSSPSTFITSYGFRCV